jgi:hypothetical protein
MQAIDKIEEEHSERTAQQCPEPPGGAPIGPVSRDGNDIASDGVATAPEEDQRGTNRAAALKPDAAPVPTPTPVPAATGRRLPRTASRTAANRANARRSTGPRTAAGKRRVSRNLPDPLASRLMGLVEARVFDQQPGAAEKLYREIIRPYEPVPPLLAMHFHDLARLHLELETWERIRDADLEERWRQNRIEKRHLEYELTVDLPGTLQEVFDKGLNRLPDSPAKSRKQVECLYMLEGHLKRRNYDIAHILDLLFGKDHNPENERAQNICMYCDRLLKPRSGKPLKERQFESLLQAVAEEKEAALTQFGFYLDRASLPDSACRARLRRTREDRAMSLDGERLRLAIDRKQRVITSLLRALKLDVAGPAPERVPPPLAQPPRLQTAASSRRTQKRI